MKSAVRILLVAATIWMAGLAHASPCIGITSLPAYGVWNGRLQGKTNEADPGLHRVAVYIFLPGQGWYTKPYFDAPCTIIQSDGTWSCSVTTGGIDDRATMFAAFLIPNSACGDQDLMSNGLACIPKRAHEVALDQDIRARGNPNQRIINFAGYEWLVKSSDGAMVGPGPNFFSDSPDNVWVDAQSRLHLKMTFADGKWWCAEVICRHPLGYGTYRFYLDSPADDLDPNVVLGLFTYSDECSSRRDGCTSAHREIDIEFTRWGNAADPTNAQSVVQEYDCEGHLERFVMPEGTAQSTNSFTWSKEAVSFRSSRGHSRTPSPEDILHQWIFAKPGEIPDPGLEQARINLYLVEGQPPQNGLEREVIVKDFEFATSIPHAKGRPDGTRLRLEGRPVSGAWPDCFYVEEDGRSAGLRVEGVGQTPPAGTRADVFGMMGTNTDGERYLEAVSCSTGAPCSVEPVGMANREIGGSDIFRKCFSTLGQSGVQSGHGLNNLGLLIRTWGTVTGIGEGYLYINDGSNISDGSGYAGVRIICGTGGYGIGDHLVVTGISSCFDTGTGLGRRILTRDGEDVQRITGN